MKKVDNVIQSDRGALLCTALGVVGFSGTLPATRLAAPHLGAIQVGLGRALVAALCGAVWLLSSRARRPSRNQCKRLLLVSLGVVVGFPWLSAWALTYTSAGRASVIVAIIPLLTAIVSSWREGTRQSLRFWIGSSFGTACVLGYLTMTGSTDAVPASVGKLPELALALAACCAALGYTEGARLTKELGGLNVISWALLLSVPLVLPLVLSQGPLPSHVPISAWLGLIYVSLISMFIAFYFWYSGLSRAGVARASQVQLMQPLLSVLWAVIVLGESFSMALALTAVCVLGAIVLVIKPSAAVRGGAGN